MANDFQQKQHQPQPSDELQRLRRENAELKTDLELRNEESKNLKKAMSAPTETAAVAEKINTRAATPGEVFESRLSDLIDDVLRRKISPPESVFLLHNFWKHSLTSEERDSIISPDAEGSVHEAGRRLSTAANMLASEMPSLVAIHQSMKGIS